MSRKHKDSTRVATPEKHVVAEIRGRKHRVVEVPRKRGNSR